MPVAYHSSSDMASVKYIEYLTPYAYNFVKKADWAERENETHPKDDQEHNQVDSSEGLLEVSSTSCACML